MGVVQGVDCFPSGIIVKFNTSVRVSSIINADFTVVDGGATPVAASFKPIIVGRDYNSINRALSLYYLTPLVQGHTYTLTIRDMVNAANVVVPTDHFDFVPAPVTDPIVVEDLDALPPVPITIIDKSFISSAAALISSEVLAVPGIPIINPHFYITGTDPENYELYLNSGFHDGRVTIKFSEKPQANFLTNEFFRAQSKKIQRIPSRWVDIPLIIAIDSVRPWVYLYFPSTDATPVYQTVGKTYFLNGYKYRIKISQYVGGA